MAASLLNTANLANDIGFRNRVQAAMVTAAINVAAEPVGTQNNPTYQTRHNLAYQILSSPGGFLDRFAWAVAANVTVSGGLGNPVSIVSSTAVNPSVITTAVHGLTTGDVVEISGHLINTAVIGTFPVTVLTTTTFSVPVLGNGAGGATGTVQKQPPDTDIQFTVNSVFSDIAGVGVLT